MDSMLGLLAGRKKWLVGPAGGTSGSTGTFFLLVPRYGGREGMEVRRAVATFPCQHVCGTSRRRPEGLVQVPGLVEACWDVRETK